VKIDLRASLKTFLFLSFGEELKGEVKMEDRFLEMPLRYFKTTSGQ
jgi:hypothetical protein